VWRALAGPLALACLAGVLAGGARAAAPPAVRVGAAAGWSDARAPAAAPVPTRALPTQALPTRALRPPAPVRRALPWPAATPAIGRVFYTLGGREYSCTGTAVRSANRSLVLTAGHCVNAGPGAYATDWVFVPGYRNGHRPYGSWPAARLVAPTGWVRSGATPDDVGFAVVAPQHGRRLTDVVGGLPVDFDGPRGAYVWAVGYPAAAPDNGDRALYCRGAERPDPYRTGSQGLACSMAQGASGGPWLTAGADGRPAAVSAVTSFTYRGMAGEIWAPYLGPVARRLYTAVQRRPAGLAG
jgi:hypothetical protein